MGSDSRTPSWIARLQNGTLSLYLDRSSVLLFPLSRLHAEGGPRHGTEPPDRSPGLISGAAEPLPNARQETGRPLGVRLVGLAEFPPQHRLLVANSNHDRRQRQEQGRGEAPQLSSAMPKPKIAMSIPV